MSLGGRRDDGALEGATAGAASLRARAHINGGIIMGSLGQPTSTSGLAHGAGGPGLPAVFAARRQAFRALHESGCFVIPNPWDVGSARYLQHLGFPALATTSAGFAFSQGFPDQGAEVVFGRD